MRRAHSSMRFAHAHSSPGTRSRAWMWPETTPPDATTWDEGVPAWAKSRAQRVLDAKPRFNGIYCLNIEASGWPMRALALEYDYDSSRRRGKTIVVRGGLSVPHPRNGELLASRGYGVSVPCLP